MFGLGAFAPYRYLALALLAVLILAGSYLQGRADGRAAEAATWQKVEIDRQQKASIERAQLQHALDARVAELAARQQEASDAVAEVRVEYLPAKTIVKREIVERPVYRDCRISDGMRDTLNAALRGTPVTRAAFDSGAAGMPGGAGAIGG